MENNELSIGMIQWISHSRHSQAPIIIINIDAFYYPTR